MMVIIFFTQEGRAVAARGFVALAGCEVLSGRQNVPPPPRAELRSVGEDGSERGLGKERERRGK